MEYSIRYSSKESVEYREGDTTYDFWLDLFVDVPREEDWDRVVPEAFRGRRGQIIERLRNNRLLANTPFRDVYV